MALVPREDRKLTNLARHDTPSAVREVVAAVGPESADAQAAMYNIVVVPPLGKRRRRCLCRRELEKVQTLFQKSNMVAKSASCQMSVEAIGVTGNCCLGGRVFLDHVLNGSQGKMLVAGLRWSVEYGCAPLGHNEHDRNGHGPGDQQKADEYEQPPRDGVQGALNGS